MTTTFPALLQARLARDPGSPFLTFYDDASGERTELSVTTYANWVSKSANLLADELMLDPGDAISIDLPPHWLGAVFLGATAAAGVEIAAGADVALVGPGGWESATATTVVATALHPFATRFSTPLPAGVLDHGALWAGQPDVFSPVEPTPLETTPDDRRVLTDLNPLSPEGAALLVGLLAGSGSLVLVARAEESRWPARSQSERATASVRATAPI
ncbi:MAG: TIGR03089 family protein [Nocardioidaceae bacterium]|nr:TIGR03089 family protein [Nocardioidaceae bacterium]